MKRVRCAKYQRYNTLVQDRADVIYDQVQISLYQIFEDFAF